MSTRTDLDHHLQHAHDSGIPAIQAVVFQSGQSVYESALGAADSRSIFDVASITKFAASSLLSACFIERGLLCLEDPVSSFFPELEQTHAGIQVQHLLAHSSGLPAWRPFFQNALGADGLFPSPNDTDAFEECRQTTIQSILKTAPTHPPGSQRIYSDTGFLLLGFLLEQIGSSTLDELCTELIFAPAQLENTRFLPLNTPPSSSAIMPTGNTRPRQPAPGQEGMFVAPSEPQDNLYPGQVDDDNAYALGGVAGHAGLFSTAHELAHLGAMLLEELQGAKHFNCRSTLEVFATPNQGPEGAPRGLGFDLPAPTGSSAGNNWGQGPQGGIGHLGFTGCSIWLDRDHDLSAVLLSNRVLPGRQHVAAIRELRPNFYTEVHERFGSKS